MNTLAMRLSHPWRTEDSFLQGGHAGRVLGSNLRTQKCSLSPPQRTVLPTLSLQLSGIQGTENLGVSSGRVSQTGSKDSHTLIPGQLPSDSLTPRGDTTQWAGQHSFKARPAPPFTYLWLWEPTGLCFLFRQMKTIGPTKQVVMRIK